MIFAFWQKNHLIVSPLESLRVTQTNETGMGVTELLLCFSTRVKVDGQLVYWRMGRS